MTEPLLALSSDFFVCEFAVGFFVALVLAAILGDD